MQFHTGIIPFVEARFYLSKRFIKERMSCLIEKNRFKKDSVPNYDFTYVERIVKLEHDLDNAFPITNLMNYYFKPLELREERFGPVVSIGNILLNHLSMLTEETNIDTLIEAFNSRTQDEIISQFYTGPMLPFGLNANSKYTLADFMQATNELLVDPQEKWALIDAVTNPVEHLIKLRPLVSAVMEFIQSRKGDFSPLITSIGQFLSSEAERNALFVEQVHLSPADLERTVIFPCLFMFNAVNIRAYETDIEVLFGSFYDVLIRYKRFNHDPETHLSLLKVITDSTRFNVLHELCNKRSYGLELAEKYGITRNAMYYDLGKLAEKGLLQMEFEDRRMLHTMDKRAVYEKLTALRDYLVNGWKPEDDME